MSVAPVLHGVALTLFLFSFAVKVSPSRLLHQVPPSRLLLRVGLQLVNVDELGLLQELSARQVHLLLLLRQEADVQGADVLLHAVLVLRLGTAVVLDGRVERAQAVNLHLLRVQQHLHQAGAELLQHTEHHVCRVQATVLRNVLRQLARVQRLQALDVGVPLLVGATLGILVLNNLIDNLCHNLLCVFGINLVLRPATSGGRHPAFFGDHLVADALRARTVLSVKDPYSSRQRGRFPPLTPFLHH